VVGVATEPDEVLEIGRERLRLTQRWQRIRDRVALVPIGVRVAGASVVVVSVGVALVLMSDPAQSPEPLSARVASLPVGDQHISMIGAMAAEPGPLPSYIRSTGTPGECELVRIGHRPPQEEIVSAVRRVFADYRVRDVAATLDQLGAICTVIVRAIDRQGSVLVVDVVAPDYSARPTVHKARIESSTNGTTTVSVAVARPGRGWTVRVGAVGLASELPSAARLRALADNPALRW
jgi:hypothetical protein